MPKQEEMWSVGLGIVTLLIIFICQWVYKWRNPKCNGVLPPGSMGFPLIGETFQFIIPKGRSLDLHPFLKSRIQRYGPVFRTSLVGQPVVVSADPEFNNFIFQQDGDSIEFRSLATFSQVFEQVGESNISAAGSAHKYLRNKMRNQFGFDILKKKLLPQMEEMVDKTLRSWSSQASVEAKHASATMVFNFTAKQVFSYDYEDPSKKLISEHFTNFLGVLLSFPLNIPGTKFHQCLKDKDRIISVIKGLFKEKLSSSETSEADFLDQTIKDLNTDKFITEDYIAGISFAILFASFEALSSALALALKFLSEHPSVVEELTAEHEAILKNRKSSDSTLTWDEYKSMTFTLQVIHETLRLATVGPGVLRMAAKDIQVNGYTIPAGWSLLLVSGPLQLDPETFKDPLAFNPERWKNLDSSVISKNIRAFGGGTRQCPGADFAKAFMAIFLHVLVTKYRLKKIKGGDLVQKPLLRFAKGLHINISGKE